MNQRDMLHFIQSLRDPQASGVYRAQQQVFYPGMTLEQARQLPPDFETEAEAQGYARQVQSSKLVQTEWPKFAAFKDLTVRFNDALPEWTSAQTYNAYPFNIDIGESGWSRQKRTLIHELSHVIDNVEYGHVGFDARHGPRFAGIFLKLLKEFVGDTPADALAAQFKLNHVEVV